MDRAEKQFSVNHAPLKKGNPQQIMGAGLLVGLVLAGAALVSSQPATGADATLPASGGPRSQMPNVILVLTDDQGYGDMSCHGNPILTTPAIDVLHRQAVRLTDFHVDPCCSPTRAALLTGRYSSRVGVWHTVQGRSILRANETTMAEVFAANGYRTGMFGKWHLGDSYPFRPHDHGFQEALYHGGGAIGNSPDYWGNRYFDGTYFRNGVPEKFAGYCTDVWFDQATRFIRAHRDRPFFCYLSLNVPHWPLLVAEKYSKPFEGKVPADMARFYGMIANFDENLGRLRQELRQLGLEDNTIFIFMTDNGTADGVEFDDKGNVKAGFNAGMRGTKISEYDGGHRVPCLVFWPAGGIGGGRDLDRLAAHFDVLPTLIDLCALTSPSNVKFDGLSLAPWLRNPAKPPASWPERTLFVHNQRVVDPVKGKNYAVMTDRWRCVNGRELYEIKSDPGQRNNVAGLHPGVLADLQKDYERWWRDISTDFDQPARMVIGSDRANPTSLNSHDWIGRPRELFDQSQVRQGRAGRDGVEYQGHWMIEVARSGRYEIEFRRWPRELNQPITAAIPGGTALPATQAKLKIGGLEQTQPVTAEALGVAFSINLKAGPTTLEGRFIDEKSGKERGPFYVYVKRVD
jgi:arylsulfatase A-like enzyme